MSWEKWTAAQIHARRQLGHQLLDHCAMLEDDEFRIVAAMAERLWKGQKQYGALAIKTDRRDWKKETWEEVIDGLVYAGIALIKEG